jgi:hypothetical protein
MSEKSIFENYNIRVNEDMSGSKFKVRVNRTKMVNEQTVNIVISVPYFESTSFKTRAFEITFEKKN